MRGGKAMLMRFITVITAQILDNLLLPPVSLGFEDLTNEEQKIA
jgi:hypothetical protein